MCLYCVHFRRINLRVMTDLIIYIATYSRLARPVASVLGSIINYMIETILPIVFIICVFWVGVAVALYVNVHVVACPHWRPMKKAYALIEQINCDYYHHGLR